MTRIDVAILLDDEESDVASLMLNACGIEYRDFNQDERIFTKENFEQNYKILAKMVEGRAPRNAPYFVLGYFSLLTGRRIEENMKERIIEIVKKSIEEERWSDKGFSLKRKAYLKDFKDKLIIQKYGQKMHSPIFKYLGEEFLKSKVVVGMQQLQEIYESKIIQDYIHINLDGWSLEYIPKEIYPLKHIESLSLEFNKIKEIPNELSNLESLKHLYLNYNELESLPDSFGDLASLETLDLSNNNNLRKLPQSISKLEKLKYIVVGETKIKKAPTFLKNAEFEELNQTIYKKS